MLARTAPSIAGPVPWHMAFKTRLFPDHGDIAVKTILSVWLAYFALILLAGVFSQTGAPQSQIANTLFQSVLSATATWLLYRLMAGLGVANALLCLTIPAAFIAFIICYGGTFVAGQQFLTGFSWLSFNAVLFTYLILAAWGGLYLTLVSARETRKASERSQAFEKASRESQLRALRYQLNPHFVFNALNSVSSLIVDEKNREAERLVDGLADYMRTVLNDDGDKIVSVEREIAQQVRYLEIEQIRFPDRLTYDVQTDPSVSEWKVPALLLQPLVENAIKYGVSQSSEAVHIAISAKEEAGRLKLSVENTGRMHIPEPQVGGDLNGTGTGLSNIREQLAAVYGPAASLMIGNSANNIVVATMIIPDERLILLEL